MAIIANWLRPTDVVGSASAGAHLGLAIRAANQQAAAQAAAQEAAQARQAQDSQQAADLLRYHYDALSQARDNELRKEREAQARDLLSEKRLTSLDNYRNSKEDREQGKLDAKEALTAREGEQTQGLTDALANGEELQNALLNFPFASRTLRADLLKDYLSQRVTERADKRKDYGTETFDVEAVKDSPAVPASPRGSGFLWMSPTPAKPAVIGHPAMKVTRPARLSAIDALNAPAPAVAPDNGGLSAMNSPDEAEAPVSVKAGQIVSSPDGKKFRAKKDAVLPAGFSVVE